MGVVGGAGDRVFDGGTLLLRCPIMENRLVCASVILFPHSWKYDWKLIRFEEIVVMFVSSLLFWIHSSLTIASRSLILCSRSGIGVELIVILSLLLGVNLLLVAMEGVVVTGAVGIVDVVAEVVVGSLGNWASKSCRYLLMVGVVVVILLGMTGMQVLMRRELFAVLIILVMFS